MAEELIISTVEEPASHAVIKVIGLGGGGCNAISNMMSHHQLDGIELISANTDRQSLESTKADRRIALGKKLTKGLGAGADPDIGRDAAVENREDLKQALTGANMVFITTGMGGGTGTGAAPVVAEIAKEMGILTVAVVTFPFAYEGKRIDVAQKGIDSLKNQVDSLIVIPNDKLLEVLGEDITMRDALKAADDVLRAAVAGIAEIITCPGYINLDFADVRNVMSITGLAMMGSAEAAGEDRARLATEEAIASPLLDNISLDGARGVLVNITTAPGCLKMSEYQEITGIVSQYAASDAELKYGTAEDSAMAEDTIRITIIATGLKEERQASGREHLNVTKRRTGTDDAFADFEIGGVIQSGRGQRTQRYTAEDFRDRSVLDNFEIPTALRRQQD